MDVCQSQSDSLNMERISEQQFFSVMECMEAYLAAQEELAAALKDGLFDIAKGKYALGSGTLGKQRYPGDMQAAVKVEPQQPVEQADSLYEQFQLHDHGQHEHVHQSVLETEDQVQQQRQQQQCQQDADGSSGRDSSPVDPITWFSALPPAPLKAAQAHFRTALQRAVLAANRVQQLRQLLDDLQDHQDGSAAETTALRM